MAEQARYIRPGGNEELAVRTKDQEPGIVVVELVLFGGKLRTSIRLDTGSVQQLRAALGDAIGDPV